MSIFSKLKKLGKKEPPAPAKAPKKQKVYKILLLTNCDSDNLGDQVIEACDIALLSAAMKNLGFSEDRFQIISKPASIVSADCVKYRTPKLMARAEKPIKNCDLVVFGGAPMFNFLYQIFYERTAITLEIAAKYKKPVLFSAIGIEGYSDTNPKCQRLKKALNMPCVRQITTRDDYASLLRYREREDLFVGHVADPAVFTKQVFAPYCAPAPAPDAKKKVGIFILRANGFTDNKVDFSRDRAAELWVDTIKELEERGYDYELVTSGHFGDEAFMDSLIRRYGVKATKCVFNMDTPEQLIEKISSYSGVVSCRLHPSIISFSLQVPSVGVVWNTKVRGFYDSTNYSDRTVPTETISPAAVVDKLEQAMAEGVAHDEKFLMSVYETLFRGIRNAFCPKKEAAPYSYEELSQAITVYAGTSPEDAAAKRRRKFRRTYAKYNEQSAILYNLRHGKTGPIPMRYFSADPNGTLKVGYAEERGEDRIFESGSHEYTAPSLVFRGDGTDRLVPNQYQLEGYTFEGWRLRIRSGQCWFWYAPDGTFATRGDLNASAGLPKAVIGNEAALPRIPLSPVESIVVEACWKKAD